MFFDHIALRPQKRGGLLGTGTGGGGGGGDDNARLRISPEKKTGETVDCRQNNGSVKAVSPRHCAATCALLSCCFNCVLGQIRKDKVRCTAVEEQPEAKEVQRSQPSSTAPAHDLFWANLRVQLHLPPLDLAWNPVMTHTGVRVISRDSF